MIRASGAITSGQGMDYYEREYSRGDYYAHEGEEVPGRWSGRGAQALGLEGAVQ
jgi:hypothetical protein